MSLDKPPRAPSARPGTHDISRVGYHIEDLKTFGDILTDAAAAAFPNRGKPRYAAMHVLLLSWENDDLGVMTELLELRNVFETYYSFNTQEWKIPSDESHNSLAFRCIEFLKDFGSPENLLIVYYGGHGLMNDDRQCVWSCSSEADSSEVQWYALQTFFEQAKSDVLILLDCCAAASSAAGSGTGVTEVIAACGFESGAPGVGEHSFTRSLIEELKYLSNGPSFTAALLHNKVLSRNKYFKPRFAPGRYSEPRRTPVYIVLANEKKKRSIELAPMVLQNSLAAKFGLKIESSTQVSTSSSAPSGDVDMKSLESSKSSIDEIRHDVQSNCPKVLVSINLEEDQLFHPHEWAEWLKSVPALANSVVVEGVYQSDSTLLLLSLPVAVWDMLPEDRAIHFIGFVKSINMVSTPKKPNSAIKERRRHPRSETIGKALEVPETPLTPPASVMSVEKSLSDADFNATSGYHGFSLEAAAAEGHAEIVEMLLNQKANVNAENGPYGTALTAAAVGGHEKIVEMLLNQNADVNIENPTYGTPLIAAAVYGHEKIVEMLLNQNADVNIENPTYGTALIAAAVRGHEKMVEMLLNQNADVNIGNPFYGTALIAAAVRGHEKMVEMLLNQNADVNIGNPTDGTALIAAAVGGHEKIVEMLLNENADVNIENLVDGAALIAAAVRGHEKIVELLLDRNATVGMEVALQNASAGGHHKVRKILLKKILETKGDAKESRNALKNA